jgi:hypothetical protein
VGFKLQLQLAVELGVKYFKLAGTNMYGSKTARWHRANIFEVE